MGVKQMLRTLDSEELTLQMAYDLVASEDGRVAPQRGDLPEALLGIPEPPLFSPTAAPGPVGSPVAPDRLFQKLDRFWGEHPDAPAHG
jgi:hypothetical protein